MLAIVVWFRTSASDFIIVFKLASWALAGIFPEGVETARIDENDLFFGAPKAQAKLFAIFSAFSTQFKDTGTKAYLRERILGGACCNEGVCDVSYT